MTWTCPGNVTISVGHGTGAPSVIPGTEGLPSMTGLPMTMTLVETDAPGTGSTVAVVHGLEAGEGGTGHVVGFAAMSPAQIAGDPPIITLVCLGMTMTGPAWQQVITAEALTIGGTGLSLADAGRSIAGASPRGNTPRAAFRAATRRRVTRAALDIAGTTRHRVGEMTREHATDEAARLNREHPERGAYRWFARERPDGWVVARIAVPPGARSKATTATTEARPRPPHESDPRPVSHRDIGGPWAV